MVTTDPVRTYSHTLGWIDDLSVTTCTYGRGAQVGILVLIMLQFVHSKPLGFPLLTLGNINLRAILLLSQTFAFINGIIMIACHREL